MRSLRVLICGVLMAGGLCADQLYTWVKSPSTPYTDPEGTTIYNGAIAVDSPYTEPTIEYDGTLFNVDVASYSVPGPGYEIFFVLTDAPVSVPEPPLLPTFGAALLAVGALLRNRRHRHRSSTAICVS